MKKEHLTEQETQEMINLEYRPINWGCLFVLLAMLVGSGLMFYGMVNAYYYLRGLL